MHLSTNNLLMMSSGDIVSCFPFTCMFFLKLSDWTAWAPTRSEIGTLPNHKYNPSPKTSEGTSATKAARFARSTSKLATWEENPLEKQTLTDLGAVAARKCTGNRMRDMSRRLQQHGFMLHVPIHWVQDVPRHTHGHVFLLLVRS